MIRSIVLGFVLFGSACTGDDEGKELFDTAQFEERQHNEAHAKELYQEITAHYPHSEYARKVEERLRSLGSNP